MEREGGKQYNVIGVMSGTSLDGVDIAFCIFTDDQGIWKYEIVRAETVPYPESWKERLSTLENGSALDLASADSSYGHFLGHLVKDFIERNSLVPDLIASHGHTIFHNPGQQMTLQIGNGAAIAAETGLPVICDFRSLDLALGGQGAPLVPVGDRLLFAGYDYCLNLGGFANISFEDIGKRIAFDICPVNIVLNYLAGKAGYSFDKDGSLGKRGAIIRELLQVLDDLPFYKEKPPRSLGKEWVLANIFPALASFPQNIPDLIATFCEHISVQVSRSAGNDPGSKILVTGGGAFNSFLLERIKKYMIPQIIIPDLLTINFKEALIFAFLGVLRWRNECNSLSSVTGARKNNSGGAIYLG